MSESKEIVIGTAIEAPSVNALVELARSGVGVEAMERLVALAERQEERAARRAFVEALSGFRADCPQPRKTRENSQFSVTRNGRSIKAMYAPLEEVDRVARPVAARHGLAWTWNTTVTDTAIVVTCRLFHVGGHYEDSTVTMPSESKAGSSAQQKMASAQSYGMRYSLIAALGITTAEDDVDGNAPNGSGDVITEGQAADLTSLAQEVGVNLSRVLKLVGFSLSELPTSHYGVVERLLAAKRKAPDTDGDGA